MSNHDDLSVLREKAAAYDALVALVTATDLVMIEHGGLFVIRDNLNKQRAPVAWPFPLGRAGSGEGASVSRGDKDKARGLYDKYHVSRTDGSSAIGGRHEGCYYFVLDTDHDQFAVPALLAYATACEAEFPMLARDLRDMVVRIVSTGGDTHDT